MVCAIMIVSAVSRNVKPQANEKTTDNRSSSATINKRIFSRNSVPTFVRIRPRPQAIAIERGSTRSRCGGGLWLVACLPAPRKPVGNFIGGMIRQPGQHVGEPGLRIDVVQSQEPCQGDCSPRAI